MIVIADLPYRGLVLRQGFRRLLSALAATDADALRTHPLPALYAAHRAGRVRYQEEPEGPRLVLSQILQAEPGEGVEFWDSPWKSLRQGWADCDDAVRWRLAELYSADEWAYPTVATDGGGEGNRHHVLIRRRDGALEDPARQILSPGTKLG